MRAAVCTLADAVRILATAVERHTSALDLGSRRTGLGTGTVTTADPSGLGVESALSSEKRQDELAHYMRHRTVLTDRQWAVVYLRLHDGLTDDQIAALLKKSRSAVQGLRSRAAEALATQERKLRHEMHDAMRRHLDS